MPKYTFICSNCESTTQKYTSIKTKAIDCECGNKMDRLLPNISSLQSTEIVDKFLNIKHTDNHENDLKDRKSHYYWSVEVPKMVNSGIYSIETMFELGWVEYNEKHELVTRTKPPEKS